MKFLKLALLMSLSFVSKTGLSSELATTDKAHLQFQIQILQSHLDFEQSTLNSRMAYPQLRGQKGFEVVEPVTRKSCFEMAALEGRFNNLTIEMKPTMTAKQNGFLKQAVTAWISVNMFCGYEASENFGIPSNLTSLFEKGLPATNPARNLMEVAYKLHEVRMVLSDILFQIILSEVSPNRGEIQ